MGNKIKLVVWNNSIVIFTSNILVNWFSNIKDCSKYYKISLWRIISSIWVSCSTRNSFYFFKIFLFYFLLQSNRIGSIYFYKVKTHIFYLNIGYTNLIGKNSILYKNQYNRLFAHLVPRGTPVALIPVIVVIETVRNVIRPGTLSIRLAANMVAGHLLLTLLGSQGPAARGLVILGLIVRLILLLCLELAVACIQAYVFTILRSLYLNELRTVSFNKNICK